MKTPDREIEFCVTGGSNPRLFPGDSLTLFRSRAAALRFAASGKYHARVFFICRFWGREWQDCTDDAAWAEFERQMFDFEDELQRKREER